MLRNVYMFGIPNMFRNYIYIYTYIHIFIYIYIHIYIYVCMYACMYACMCVYICIYAHILYWSTAMIYLELLSPFFLTRLCCISAPITLCFYQVCLYIPSFKKTLLLPDTFQKKCETHFSMPCSDSNLDSACEGRALRE